jgi:hypothetical protein
MKKSSISMKDDYQKYLQSAHWQQRRKKAIEDNGHMCEKCDMPRWLAQIAYQQDLNVHHLNYTNLGHEEDCDLEVLCRRCHDIETFSRSDFRAPKKAKCEVCDCYHWDVYDKFCETCNAVFGITEPLSLRFSCIDPRDDEELWKSVLRELVWYSSCKPSAEFFGFITETLEKINRRKR